MAGDAEVTPGRVVHQEEHLAARDAEARPAEVEDGLLERRAAAANVVRCDDLTAGEHAPDLLVERVQLGGPDRHRDDGVHAAEDQEGGGPHRGGSHHRRLCRCQSQNPHFSPCGVCRVGASCDANIRRLPLRQEGKGMATVEGRVLSVNVGRPRMFEFNGRQVRSAIWKSPVPGRVAARGVNLEGDDQADRKAHGGPDKAVYAYAIEDLRWWETELSRSLPVAQFGENLTTEGIDVNGALV